MSVNFNELELQNIYNSFHYKIHRYLKRVVGELEAEDLAQEVFLKISQGITEFRGESKLSTWIYSIATNAALDKLRSTSFLQVVKNRVSLDSETGCEKPGMDKKVVEDEKDPAVDQQLIREEMNECIRNFIENLSGSYKTVVVLSELEGLKNREIADILCVSLDTVKIRLHRARERLKKELEKGCTFYRSKQNVLSCDLKENFEEFKKQY